jgi:SAM-dependent methyltransferase
MPVVYILIGLVVVVIGVSLVWRRASRNDQIPCPTSFAWLVDSPLADLVSGTQTTLDRIGIEPGMRLLDVGCGPGRLSIPAAGRVGPDGMVTAFDVQPGMIALLEKKAAQKGIGNITTRLGDIAAERDLPPDHFDRAWLVTVLGEIPDREAALRTLLRAIRPGGTLTIVETIRDPHFQRRETVERLCREAGFVPGQVWGSGWDYTQNFSKPGA